MPRYYCDYCDTYLTHDSPSVRKQHNAGYKHKANVRTYYQQFEEQQTQSLIDQRIKEHLGQAAAFQHQVGASFNQHLMSLQSNPQRPRLPILVPPVLPIGASPQVLIGPPLLPGVRPPVLPRPVVGVPGYGAPPTVPLSMAPPGAPSPLFQMNSLPRPPPMAPPATMGTPTPASNGTASLTNPVLYQANLPSAPTGGFNAFNASTAPGVPGAAPATAAPLQDGFAYAQTSEATH